MHVFSVNSFQHLKMCFINFFSSHWCWNGECSHSPKRGLWFWVSLWQCLCPSWLLSTACCQSSSLSRNPWFEWRQNQVGIISNAPQKHVAMGNGFEISYLKTISISFLFMELFNGISYIFIQIPYIQYWYTVSDLHLCYLWLSIWNIFFLLKLVFFSNSEKILKVSLNSIYY